MRASMVLCLVASIGWFACASDPGELDQAEDGTDCHSPGECKSGHCVDRICCNAACTESCYSCIVPDHAGTCTLDPADTQCGG